MDVYGFNLLMTVVTAHFLALLSPGPDFVLVVKSAIKNGNRKSVGVAAGIASANGVYITICLLGMGSILADSISLLAGFKIAGGLFLMYLAIQALRAKKQHYSHLVVCADPVDQSGTTFAREFMTGFLSGILNPKNLLFYLSLFTVILTQEVHIAIKFALGVWMTLIVFAWDLLIIYLLSAPVMRQKFSGAAYFIDKLTGVVLGVIGFTIVKSVFMK